MVGDTVNLDVDEKWSELPRLIERVRGVKGVAHGSRSTASPTIRSCRPRRRVAMTERATARARGRGDESGNTVHEQPVADTR